MKKSLGLGLLVCLLAFSLVLVSCDDGSPKPVTVRIVNNTGYEVYRLYAALITSSTWGQDLLGSSTLPNGSSKSIQLMSNTYYDIRLTDSYGRYYRKNNLQLTSGMTLTFTYADLSNN